MKFKIALMFAILALLSACASLPHSSTETNKDDKSVRAIGTHKDGNLLIKPHSEVIATNLGAPSCYGIDTDMRWSGDYEVLWEPTSGGDSSIVMAFPMDFEIIQPSEEPVNLQKLTLGDTELFTYIPRYTDCHALDTYLFGISNGKAFPINFEIEPGKASASIGQNLHKPIQVINDELILIGGEGAGQDFTDVYHFHYDSSKHSMILLKTDRKVLN